MSENQSPSAASPAEEEQVKTQVTDEQIKTRLREILKDADLEKTTEKQLRKQLGEEFQCDLSDRKALVREEVNAWLAENDDEEEAEEEEEEQPKKKRAPGGFSKTQAVLSPALSEFLGVKTLPRPQVVKKIWEHIKANNLQDPKDKRKIILDDKLKTIFKGTVTMFNMNKQLSAHCKSEGGVSKRRRGSDDEDESEGSEEEDEESGDDEEPKPKKSRAAPKAAKAKSPGAGNRSNNSFTKPLPISDALSEFMGGEKEASRPEMTKKFWEYFKGNGLQDPKDKRIIVCDERLKELLGVDKFQAFSLMKFLKPHILT